MYSIFIPNEDDFRRWIRDAVKQCLESMPVESGLIYDGSPKELLLNRKEVAAMFKISLVTLHDWMNRGMPFHKQRGRVYFLRSEVMEHVKMKRRSSSDKT